MRENRRAVMSRRMIRTTLVEMLQRESLARISVTKLCKEADINRSTFYAHYMDIYEVMEDIEEDFIQKISFSRMGNVSGALLNQVRNLLSYVDKHRDTYLVLLKNGYLKERYVEVWLHDQNISLQSEKKEKVYRLIAKCTVDEMEEIIRAWAAREIEIPYQELTILLCEVIQGMKNIQEKLDQI